MKSIINICVVAITLLAFTPHTFADELVVRCLGLKAKEGYLYVKLFAINDDFPKSEHPYAVYKVRAFSRTINAVFGNIPEGIYAVQAFQDLNSDHSLNQTIIGLPTEPVGYSNGADGRVKLPSFNDAAIVVSDEKELIKLVLQ